MEKINISELLKDCPMGMELDCTIYDNATFCCILEDNRYPIKIQTPEGHMLLSKYGCMSLSAHTKCVIFPKGKTTWEGFVPPCKFKDGDILYIKTDSHNHIEFIIIFKEIRNNHIHKHACFAYQNLSIDKCAVCHIADVEIMRLATEEEKQKLFDAIKENGYKWNDETKTLEKLVPNKFDITTLVPFESKVLVRDDDVEIWIPAIWGIYDDEYGINYPYLTIGGNFAQCIPYEGNEHLLGTNNECNEYYKTWI